MTFNNSWSRFSFGCSAIYFNTDSKCPECSGNLRIIGDLQTDNYTLACPQCGYQGKELSVDEIAEYM